MAWDFEYYIELYCHNCMRTAEKRFWGNPHQERMLGCKQCGATMKVVLPVWFPKTLRNSNLDIFIESEI